MSKNIVAVIVHNRRHNIERWLHCWAQSTPDAELVIIHNTDSENYADIIPPGVTYLQRANKGYDIGALQDVCRGRLAGFPDYDKLLWCTDDTLPMAHSFTRLFWEALDQPGIGCACMTISPYVRQHIRTTGFAVSRETAERLSFPADPLDTKEQCYQFEHRHPTGHLLRQIQVVLKLKAHQVAPDASSPLLDFGYHRRLKARELDHYRIFGGQHPTAKDHRPKIVHTPAPEPVAAPTPYRPLVVFICPTYNNYPQIVSSLICQTYDNWQLHLVHDGPELQPLSLPDDPRIIYTQTAERRGNWGHEIRAQMLQQVQGDYVVITNPDNYHAPVYIERMLAPFKDPKIQASYCEAMVHSYKNWGVIPTALRRGFLDCAGVMLRLSTARAVGWHDVTSHSADWFFFEAVIKKTSIYAWARVKGCLLVHN